MRQGTAASRLIEGFQRVFGQGGVKPPHSPGNAHFAAGYDPSISNRTERLPSASMARRIFRSLKCPSISAKNRYSLSVPWTGNDSIQVRLRWFLLKMFNASANDPATCFNWNMSAVLSLPLRS